MLDVHGRGSQDVRPGMPTRLPQLQMRVTQGAAAPVVTLDGEIDLNTIGSLRACLDRLEGRVVVDLAAVSFVDASGLGVFAGTRTRLRGGGGDLRVRSPHDHVRRVLEITGLDDLIVNAKSPIR
jgi:anti-anti-sigma factor